MAKKTQKPAEPKTKTALILSGGAPNATLMAGALCRLHEEGVRFDVISASGAGTAVALFYLVPSGIQEIPEDDEKQLTELKVKALRSSTRQGVEDLLFRLLPLNFKVFQKPGRMADAYRKLTAPWLKAAHGWLDTAFEMVEPLRAPEQTRQRIRNSIQRLAKIRRFDEKRFAHDVIDLWHALLSPTWITRGSEGLCAHPPQLDEFVVIDRIKDLPNIDFYMNSFNLTRGQMQIFAKEHITRDHFYAALAYPFFYPPYRMPNGDYHIEGAAIDALNYRGLLGTNAEISTILVIDVAGKRKLMHKPRDLFDAFAQSIMTPLIEVARDDTKLFEKYMEDEQRFGETFGAFIAAGVAAELGKEAGEKSYTAEEEAEIEAALDSLSSYKGQQPEVFKLPVEMADEEWQRALEWATSNLEAQFDIGYESAGKFLQDNEKRQRLGLKKLGADPAPELSGLFDPEAARRREAATGQATSPS